MNPGVLLKETSWMVYGGRSIPRSRKIPETTPPPLPLPPLLPPLHSPPPTLPPSPKKIGPPTRGIPPAHPRERPHRHRSHWSHQRIESSPAPWGPASPAPAPRCSGSPAPGPSAATRCPGRPQIPWRAVMRQARWPSGVGAWGVVVPVFHFMKAILWPKLNTWWIRKSCVQSLNDWCDDWPATLKPETPPAET